MDKHKEILARLTVIEKRFDDIEDKLEPMYEIFVSAKGFNDIGKTILKALILIGAGTAVIYGFIRYLKS